MNAHKLGETGDVLVTGTQDPEAARPLALSVLIDTGATEEEAVEYLERRHVSVTEGTIVPATKADREDLGYTWWWREGKGRVKAVVWE